MLFDYYNLDQLSGAVLPTLTEVTFHPHFHTAAPSLQWSGMEAGRDNVDAKINEAQS